MKQHNVQLLLLILLSPLFSCSSCYERSKPNYEFYRAPEFSSKIQKFVVIAYNNKGERIDSLVSHCYNKWCKVEAVPYTTLPSVPITKSFGTISEEASKAGFATLLEVVVDSDVTNTVILQTHKNVEFGKQNVRYITATATFYTLPQQKKIAQVKVERKYFPTENTLFLYDIMDKFNAEGITEGRYSESK